MFVLAPECWDDVDSAVTFMARPQITSKQYKPMIGWLSIMLDSD